MASPRIGKQIYWFKSLSGQLLWSLLWYSEQCACSKDMFRLTTFSLYLARIKNMQRLPGLMSNFEQPSTVQNTGARSDRIQQGTWPNDNKVQQQMTEKTNVRLLEACFSCEWIQKNIHCDTILSNLNVIKACQSCYIFTCIIHPKTVFAALGIYCHLRIQKCLWTKLSHETSSQKWEKLSFYEDWDVVSNFKYCNLHSSRQKQEAYF